MFGTRVRYLGKEEGGDTGGRGMEVRAITVRGEVVDMDKGNHIPRGMEATGIIVRGGEAMNRAVRIARGTWNLSWSIRELYIANIERINTNLSKKGRKKKANVAEVARDYDDLVERGLCEK
jgi:hypothetical protein